MSVTTGGVIVDCVDPAGVCNLRPTACPTCLWGGGRCPQNGPRKGREIITPEQHPTGCPYPAEECVGCADTRDPSQTLIAGWE